MGQEGEDGWLGLGGIGLGAWRGKRTEGTLGFQERAGNRKRSPHSFPLNLRKVKDQFTALGLSFPWQIKSGKAWLGFSK
jgi:hypothetical protein